MARKVIDITRSVDKYDILSQTPKNYSNQNYYLKELQDKVNAEWEYRPNRVDVEYENTWGKQQYSSLEVVAQSVKSEKGTDISNDIKCLVFRNITENRFVIGSRFRFASNFHNYITAIAGSTNNDIPANIDDIEDVYMEDDDTLIDDYTSVQYRVAQKNKNVWLVTNTDQSKLTSNVIVQRCNGSLGSTYVDDQGVSHRHYEPVIQGDDVSGTALRYSETAVLPQSQLLIICQHNEITKKYFINQRFIIGYDKVYRITAINKFYGNSTFNPEDVGLMRIYLEITERSPYDDFVKRIAYQQTPEVIIDTEDSVGGLGIKFTEPAVIPTSLGDTSITFKPVLYNEETGSVYETAVFTINCVLDNLPSTISSSVYVSCVDEGNNTFKVTRNRRYMNGDVHLTFTVSAASSPSGEEVSVTLTMSARE